MAMATNFDTGMRLADILLEVGEEVNALDYDATTGLAQLPTGELLAKIRRHVNAGYRYFARSNPRWTWLEHRVVLTLDPTGKGPDNIEQDPARYRLPDYIQGRPKGNWTFIDEISAYETVLDTSWDYVRQRFAVTNNTTGTPRLAGISVYQPEIGRQGWQVLFWPSPGTAFTIEAQFRIRPRKLINLDDRLMAGSDHDEAIIKCAVEDWRRMDEDDPTAWERAQQARDQAIRASILIDLENVPGRLGRWTDPGAARGHVNPRLLSYNGVTTYNGTDVATTNF